MMLNEQLGVIHEEGPAHTCRKNHSKGVQKHTAKQASTKPKPARQLLESSKEEKKKRKRSQAKVQALFTQCHSKHRRRWPSSR
jgi:hypothetical protein